MPYWYNHVRILHHIPDQIKETRLENAKSYPLLSLQEGALISTGRLQVRLLRLQEVPELVAGSPVDEGLGEGLPRPSDCGVYVTIPCARLRKKNPEKTD